jgi:chromosome segregation ATPase
MADNNTPFSVRMEQEDKEKLIQLIQDSGKSNKEFMTSLISSYELNKAKIEIPDIAQDIEGLEALTKQINDYYVNMGKRITEIQKSKDVEFTKSMEIYTNRIEVLKAENDKVNGQITELTQAYNNVNADYEETKKQMEQLLENLKDKNLLVEEYKQKNDTMTGVLNEYKEYKGKIENLKKSIDNLQIQNNKLSNDSKEKDITIQKLENELEKMQKDTEKSIHDLNIKHSEDIKVTKEKVKFEKDKDILELNKQHQNELQEQQRRHNEEIQEYQNKYKRLLDELNEVKTSLHSRVKQQKKQSTNNKTL